MTSHHRQRIMVFQQNGSGETKIRGIRQHGGDRFDLTVVDIDETLPPVIDDADAYLPDTISADLVLDYLTHPDLSHDLSRLCRRLGIPVVASGRKTKVKGTVTPPTCCGLAPLDRLGTYARQFGAPEFDVTLSNGRISEVRVVRGAPCGATWEAAARMIGLAPEEAVRRMGLDTQFFCTANPAGWDPIYGKSPVHFAGEVHSAALRRAIGRQTDDD